MMNITNQEDFMEDVTQLALDVSIMEGFMDTRMKDTGIKMSMVGQEVGTFEVLTVPQDTVDGDIDDSDENTQEVDFQQGGTVLQWVGIVMFLVNLFVFLLLTNLARRRRLERESKAKLDENLLTERAGLVTEHGVNQMLDISRGESLRILRNEKMYHSSWEDSDSEYKSPNENEVEEVVPVHNPIRDISIPLGTTDAVNNVTSTGTTSAHSNDESSVWYDCVQHMSDENKIVPPPSLGVEMSVRTSSSYREGKSEETTTSEPNDDDGGTLFHRLRASFMASLTS
jgi:membrane protein implicated in regulation of membrane protease activity